MTPRLRYGIVPRVAGSPVTYTLRCFFSIALILSLSPLLQCQTTEKVLNIRVMLNSPQRPIKNVVLGTNGKTSTSTDNFGHANVELDENFKEGTKLSLVVLSPLGYEIASISASQIPPERFISVKIRPIGSSVHTKEETESSRVAQSRLQAQIIDTAATIFAKGTSLYADGKYEEAARALTVAVNLDPDEPMLANLLGMCLTELKQFDRAEEILTTARGISVKRERGIGPLTQKIDGNLNELRRRKNESVP
jgi:tetratricopeptide (TPR) repeat protein